MPAAKSSPAAEPRGATGGGSAASPASGDLAPGRPAEIELASNRRLIHPLSARLVDALAATAITPNQVSVAGVLAAAAAAASLVWLGWPWAALAAALFLLAWHVLDGADGDLARRTGRASPLGELVDGVCDHAAQGLIYVALAIVLGRRVGAIAWPIAVLSSGCHFVQANAYESWRKTYRRFAYGAPWMRQTFAGGSGDGVAGRLAAGAYLALSNLFLPRDDAIAALMARGAAEGRERYREAYAPLVRRAGWLSSNTRTAALVGFMLVGGPGWYFAFEIVVLTAILAMLAAARRRMDRRFIARLAA